MDPSPSSLFFQGLPDRLSGILYRMRCFRQELHRLNANLRNEIGPFATGLNLLEREFREFWEVHPKFLESRWSEFKTRPTPAVSYFLSVFQFLVDDFEKNVKGPIKKAIRGKSEPAAIRIKAEVRQQVSYIAMQAEVTEWLLTSLLDAEREGDPLGANLVRWRDQVAKEYSIISVDLARYGQDTGCLAGFFGGSSKVVYDYNREIRSEIDKALTKCNVSNPPVVETGDGAIVVLSSATDAIRFSMAIHDSARRFNEEAGATASRFFRIGVGTGEVTLRERRSVEDTFVDSQMGSVTISKAVRLQTAARTGEIVICEVTKKRLGQEYRDRFEAEEIIKGKSHELPFVGFRIGPGPRAVWDDDSFGLPDGFNLLSEGSYRPFVVHGKVETDKGQLYRIEILERSRGGTTWELVQEVVGTGGSVEFEFSVESLEGDVRVSSCEARLDHGERSATPAAK